MTPRVMTQEEMRQAFFRNLKGTIEYWATDPRPKDCRERLEGLAFSILTTIDGESADLPRFSLRADPHPDDEAYCVRQGDDWWPPDGDLGDWLHEEWATKYMGKKGGP